MTTKYLTKEEAQKAKKWIQIDATGKRLGRLASEVANILRGKNKASFTPNQDCGDFVVVTNAEKIVLTGNKLNDKVYYQHSGFVGGMKSRTAGQLLATHPERVLRFAVEGMLPKGKLGRAIRRNFKVYAGAEHPHKAQKPEVL